MKLYQIETGELAILRRIAKRLYSEDRMNGDEMRNAAQAIDGVIRLAEQMEYDSEEYALTKIEPKRYGVFDNNKPASKEGYPALERDCWNTHLFPTFEQAREYANHWLGDFGPDDGTANGLALDTPVDYSGHGDTIEIRTIKEK